MRVIDGSILSVSVRRDASLQPSLCLVSPPCCPPLPPSALPLAQAVSYAAKLGAVTELGKHPHHAGLEPVPLPTTLSLLVQETGNPNWGRSNLKV